MEEDFKNSYSGRVAEVKLKTLVFGFWSVHTREGNNKTFKIIPFSVEWGGVSTNLWKRLPVQFYVAKLQNFKLPLIDLLNTVMQFLKLPPCTLWLYCYVVILLYVNSYCVAICVLHLWLSVSICIAPWLNDNKTSWILKNTRTQWLFHFI